MTEDLIFQQLAQTGVLGIICGWFMFRMEKIIKANTDALNNLSQIVRGLCSKRKI